MWSPISRFCSIEPEGILNACTMKVRAKVAKITAIRSASRYSRETDFSVCIEVGVGGSLADQPEGSPPPCIGHEVQGRAAEVPGLVADTLPGAALRAAAIRPVDEQGAALEHLGRQRSPEARVPGVLPVVPHAEVVALGHRVRTEVVAVAEVLRQIGAIGIDVGVPVEGEALVVHHLAID